MEKIEGFMVSLFVLCNFSIELELAIKRRCRKQGRSVKRRK